MKKSKFKPKFKVGDIIVAKKGTSEKYSITNDRNKFIGKISGFDGKTTMQVKTLFSLEEDVNPEAHWNSLRPEHFRKATWKERKKVMVANLVGANKK